MPRPASSPRHWVLYRIVNGMLLTILFSAFAFGQSDLEIPTRASIEARISALPSSVPDQATRDAAVSRYQAALNDLRSAAAFREQSRDFQQARAEAPVREAELLAALAARDHTDGTGAQLLEAGDSAAEIEQRLNVERAQVLAAEQVLAEQVRNLDALRARPDAARQRLAEARHAEQALTASLTATPPDAEDITGRARRAAELAQLDALRAEIEMLQAELLSQPARLSLLEVQRREAAADVERARVRAQQLQSELMERRRGEAQRAVAESDIARTLRDRDSPAVKQAVETNATLAAELTELSDAARDAAAARQAAASELDALQSRFDSAREKVSVAGLTPALGRFLLSEQRDLPEAGEFGRASRAREARIAAAGLRAIQLEESLASWRQTDLRVEALADSMAERVDATLREQLRVVVQARTDLLGQLERVNSDYLRTLSELETTEQQIRQLAGAYRDFLSRNLMWVRNETVLGPAKLVRLPEELAALLNPTRWAETGQMLLSRSAHSPLQMLAWLILLLGIWRRRWLQVAIRATARQVGRPSEDRFAVTLQAVGLTLLMALPWPLFALMTGYQLGVPGSATESSAAVGNALMRVTPLLFFLAVFRCVCVRGGLAEAHFRWAENGNAALRRALLLLAIVLLLSGFLLVVADRFVPGDQPVALLQVLFVVLVVELARFLYRLLRPSSGILERLRRKPGDGPVLRWPWFWLGMALAMPAFLGIAALAGFMYSAGMLLDRLITTLLLVLALVLVHELVVRGLLIMRRRVLLREALARREAARQGENPDGEAASPPATPESGADVASLDADSRTLISVALAIGGLLGLGAIWSPVLPALSMLDSVTLWRYAETVGDTETLRQVVLSDLLQALLVVLLTVAAARSLPALVEIFLRQRRAVPSGSRLAFATLTRYGLVLIGLGIVLSTVGINWSKLQWLVAALGVGIGFGLQEIVANFISGLIILIERPVRVGDVVTVGDASGTVSRIQIRATTIRNWDEQELIVPNKEFITGRVVNWTLSDEITRIFFMVGIAYGSDTEKALRLIHEVAQAHPSVLEEPQPRVTFESFGDNSLNLGLRCFVSAISDRLDTRTDLHLAIDRRLTEAGIVIAFPQRDIHLDTARPLEVRMVQDRPAPD